MPERVRPFVGCQNGQTWAFNPSTLMWLILGGSLVYAGGCFLNDACDHQFDQENRPERPIPQGDISLGRAWALGILQLGLGGWSLVAGAGCSWKWTLGLLLVSSLMT